MFVALSVTHRTKEYVCSSPNYIFSRRQFFSCSSRHLFAYVNVCELGSSVRYGLNDRGSICDRNMHLGIYNCIQNTTGVLQISCQFGTRLPPPPPAWVWIWPFATIECRLRMLKLLSHTSRRLIAQLRAGTVLLCVSMRTYVSKCLSTSDWLRDPTPSGEIAI
jgi:hypothetical protein